MADLYQTARPLLFMLGPERAHNLALSMMKRGVTMRAGAPVQDPALEVKLWDLKFPNPLGLAAGFDKNAEAIPAALRMGFGFVEVGTVTPKPQPGNSKPRIFRDAGYEAIINRMGFPNKGLHVFQNNFQNFLSRRSGPGIVGINIGMNKTQTEPAKDYRILIRKLGPLADYLTVNISSPNTPGLRDLQKAAALSELLSVLGDELRLSCGKHAPPLLVKLAPDLDEAQQEKIAETLMNAEIDGLILTNTTIERPAFLPEKFGKESGGLSGVPLGKRSTTIIRNFYRFTKGQIPIIGVGGISTAEDAYEKIKAGASLLQIYSALVFQGPSVINTINHRLLKLLKKDGYTSLSQAVGSAVKIQDEGD